MRFVIIFIMQLSVFFAPAVARAQNVLRDEQRQLELQVDERLPGELQAQPLVYNGFAYAPRLTLEGKYDSNVLAAPSEDSDYSLSLAPEVTIRKEYGTHKFIAGAAAFLERFSKHDGENREDYSAFLRGDIVANSNWSFPFGMGYKKEARDRAAPQITTRTVKPEDIKHFDARAGVSRSFNRLTLSLLGEYRGSEFTDGTAITTGLPVRYSDNDRNRKGGRLTARYKIPGARDKTAHTLFTDFVYGREEYDRRNNITGLSGDRDEYGALAGFESDYKGFLFMHMGAGVLRQTFDDPALDDIDIIDLEGDIAYNITPKLTLNALLGRGINQDNGFTQGAVETSYGIGADYELLHNFYLETDLGYAAYDFEDIRREDEDRMAGVALRYHSSPKLESKLSFNWQDRESDVAAAEFERYLIMLSLTGKL